MRQITSNRKVVRSSLPLLRVIAEQYAAVLGGKARDHRQRAEAALKACFANLGSEVVEPSARASAT